MIRTSTGARPRGPQKGKTLEGPRVLVSTSAYPARSARGAAQQLVEEGFSGIELSGGIYDSQNLDALPLFANHATLRMHNYFPSHEVPFSLNLASPLLSVREQSISHVKRLVRLAGSLGHTEVSFHAGFLIDPRPEELGGPLSLTPVSNRRAGISRFTDSLEELNSCAEPLGVRLLVENNPFTEIHQAIFRQNPFLFVEEGEIFEILSHFGGRVQLLLDVGHLKVSATTMGFGLKEALAKLNEVTFGYHLNDNDGRADQNLGFDESAWFWDALDTSKDYVTIEVVNPELSRLRMMWDLCRERFAKELS